MEVPKAHTSNGIPSSKIFTVQAVNNFELKSLILAQIERWRHA